MRSIPFDSYKFLVSSIENAYEHSLDIQFKIILIGTN